MSNDLSPDNLPHADPPVDLSNCEREPIHIPSRIQPHGILLVLQEPDLTIVQASDNLAAFSPFSAEEVLGKSLETLLDASPVQAVRDRCQQGRLDDNPIYLLTMQMREGTTQFDAILHRRQGALILELEPTLPETSRQDTYALIRHAVPQIQSAATAAQMFEVTAQQVRRINGFDRVMVYQFDSDGHGSVIAEAKRDDLPPFLGLHYPASDIPPQARRLYLLNLLRLIGDVTYTPANVIPAVNPVTNALLDMSYCVLRSVSPIHVQYLKNMGVAASMSISILKDGTLWGLIACHHDTPRLVSYDIRTACEFIGNVVSLQLATKQDSADAAYQMRLKDVQVKLVAQMATDETYLDGLLGHNPSILDFIDADGAVVCTNGRFHALGQVPDEAFLTRLVSWLGENTGEIVFATDALPHQFPPAEAVKHLASGLLALAISPAQAHYVLWFRAEVVQAVNWAGNPAKSVEVHEDGIPRLSPRGSFALWKETVQGKSLPWKSVEIKAVEELRGALVNIILHRAEQLEILNDQLQRSNRELDAFTYIASHDLREPLRGIRNYVQFLDEDYRDVLGVQGKEHLNTVLRLAQRMENLIESLLRYSRVGQQDLVIHTTDLNQIVQETRDVLRARLEENHVEVRIPRPLPIVPCDEAQVSEIYSNLVSNAIKYNNRAQKWIEIGYLDTVPTEFYVRDNGIGIPAKHHDTIFRIFKRLHAREEFGGGMGAGLTIARKIAERHGGKLWLSSVVGEGTTFYFTLAKAGENEQ